MSIVTQAGRTLCLIAAVCCGATSANPYPPESRLSGDTQSINQTQSRPEANSTFAMFTTRRTDQGHARTLAEPFGLQTIAAPPGEISAKWAELQPRIRSDEDTLATCRSNKNNCPAAARAFLRIVEQGRKHQGRARIAEINRAVNLSIKTMADSVQHGIDDVWSAPLATFAAGAGDCEDYAIAKYVALRQSGTASDNLRLVIVRDVRRGLNHAVVGVRFDGEWLILDNRHMVLVKATEAQHYSPLFVLDHRGVGEFHTAGLRR
jgi:predicted transglutaminase-like cysteine proteinase